MSRRARIGLLIFVLLWGICVLVVWGVPRVKDGLDRTFAVQYGSLDIVDEVQAYIVRDEVVYVAAEDCTVERLAKPCELVMSGKQVVELEVEPGAEPDAAAEPDASAEASSDVKLSSVGTTEDAGYVSYFTDGAESKLAIDKLHDLKEKDFASCSNVKPSKTAEDRCKKGEPLFKVTKNHRWYLVFFMDKDQAAKYTVGRVVRVEMDGKLVPVEVDSVEEGVTSSKVVLSCKAFYDDFFAMRRMDARITVVSADGLILETGSLVTDKDGQLGVFVKDKFGSHVFTPVSLMANNGEKCVAFSDIYVDVNGEYVETIKVYDEIVEEPTAEDLRSIGLDSEK